MFRCDEAKSGSVDSCTNPRDREIGDSFTSFTSEICPVPPAVILDDLDTPGLSGPLDDYNVYVAEELLKISGERLDANDFFLRFQVGMIDQLLP